MITRLYGSADGVDLIFAPSASGAWKCRVPAAPDGQYIIDLWAEDDAGNVAYCATVLYAVNAADLRVGITLLRFADEASLRPLAAAFGVQDVAAAAETARIRSTFGVRELAAQIVKCEVCGGAMHG